MDTKEPWPNLFVVGAAKAGTTSLHYYLSQHPDIYMSSVKEPHFFSQINPKPKFVALAGCTCIKDERSYLQLFAQGKNKKIRGEASPSYLWEEKTYDRIKKIIPDAKIVIMLREPISRAYSHYLNDVGAGIEKRPFLQAIQEDINASIKGWGVSSLYVDLGFYSRQVERYLNNFDKVLVLFFEEFITDIRGKLSQVFNFLEIDASYSARIQPEAKNVYSKTRNKIIGSLFGNPAIRILSRSIVTPAARPLLKSFIFVKDKKPDIDPQAGQLLANVYKEEIPRLKALLNRDIPWSTPC